MIPRFAGPILGILSFSIAIFSGIIADLPMTTIMTRALWAMMIFCLLGSLVGWVAQAAITDHFRPKLAALEATESAGAPDDGEEAKIVLEPLNG